MVKQMGNKGSEGSNFLYFLIYLLHCGLFAVVFYFVLITSSFVFVCLFAIL